MARKARKKSTLGIYQIIIRANYKLFLNENDKEIFLSLVERYVTFAKRGELFGYRLSDSAVHMIVAEGTQNISELMKSLCTSYARFFNRKYKTSGKLFCDRFKSEPIESQEALEKAINEIENKN